MSDDDILRRIQGALLPFDVYLRDTHLRVAEGFDPKLSHSALGFQIRNEVRPEAARLELLEPEDPQRRIPALRYIVDTGVRLTGRDTQAQSDQAEAPVRAQIEALWWVEYHIHKPEAVDQAGIDAFRENGNVMFHLWPYWREFIHASCARLRLPQVILPMFHVKRVIKQVTKPAGPAQPPAQ